MKKLATKYIFSENIMKALGMSTVFASLFSCASITEVINTDSNFSFGVAASSFLVVFLCMHPSVRFIPLIVPSRFSFKNMIDSKTYIFFCREK